LVVDLNRFEDEKECIPPEADGTAVPLNRELHDAGRKERLQRYFFPAHQAIERLIASVAERSGQEPFVVRLHSFARVLKEKPTEPRTQDICVYNYPEFGPDLVFDQFLAILRAQNPSLNIGNNDPFSARSPGRRDAPGSASPVSYRHVLGRKNSNTIALEIRQDLIQTAFEQSRFADIVANALHQGFGFHFASAYAARAS
jgi:predicted N-formylglutamate amidohydrolase